MKCVSSIKILATGLGGMLSVGATPDSGSSTKPNVIIILTDDQGYGDVECYGASSFLTPNLNQMARDGIRFTSYYSGSPVCSASRASLLTGCYPPRVGIQTVLFPWDNLGLNPSETTLAEMLKTNGYETALFGKWHLGNLSPFLPPSQGFDEFYGIPYSNDMWPASPFKDNSKYPPLHIMNGTEEVKEISNLEDQAQLTTLFTEKTVNFIKQNHRSPFFVLLSHPMPHVPLGVSEKFEGKSKQGKYGDVIMEIDWSVGEIIHTLKELGIEKNTLLIFLSDNGPWLNYGNHAGSAGALREGKINIFEGGQRVPCIMKMPGTIPSGTTCNEVITNMDIMPTIAEITESKLPENKIDGINMLGLLKGEIHQSPRKVFYYYFNGMRAIRYENWKLILPHEYLSYDTIPGSDGYPGPYSVKNTGFALYNLNRDQGERYDLKEYYPEIKEKMMKMVKEGRKELGDEDLGIIGTGVRKIGKY